MNGIVLAAGYGTRLGKLGTTLPKALLPVGEKPILDFLIDRLAAIGLRKVVMVTNARFHPAFEEWHAGKEHPFEVELLCDGSTAPENRLGAIRDMALGLERVAADEPVFVTASDNLYTSGFDVLTDRYAEVRSPVVAMLREQDESVLQRSGVAKVDADGRMVIFMEKPAEPPSPYSSPPLYIYPPDIGDDITAFLATPGLDHDAPGNLVAFLLERRAVYGVVLAGRRYDIGSLESYEEAKQVFRGGTPGNA